MRYPQPFPRDLKWRSHIGLQWKYPTTAKIGTGRKVGKLPPQQKLCRIEKSTWYLLSSKQFNFGMQSWQQITGSFYGLHLHNMHKLISLQRIKDYWGKIAFITEQRKNEFFSGTFQFKMPQFSISLLESAFYPGPTVTKIIPQSL